MIETIRCVATYVRVSSVGQVNGDGIERQDRVIDAFCEKQGWKIDHKFEEPGLSGDTSLLLRPGLTGAIQFLETTAARQLILVVEKADRLARDMLVSQSILKECRDLGIQIYSAEGGIDLTSNDDPTTVLVNQMLTAIAQFDKNSHVKRMRVGREKKKRDSNGLEGNEGTKPYGHHAFPGELGIANEIFFLSDSCISNEHIAYQLNELGHRTRKGKLFKRSTIYKIVNNKRSRHLVEEGRRNKLIVGTCGTESAVLQ